jgi:hypothetical protein
VHEIPLGIAYPEPRASTKRENIIQSGIISCFVWLLFRGESLEKSPPDLEIFSPLGKSLGAGCSSIPVDTSSTMSFFVSLRSPFQLGDYRSDVVAQVE